jgi:hypothetical protein
MKISISDNCHAHAERCLQQSHLSKDAQIKMYWEELATEWLALEKVQAGSPAIAISPRAAAAIRENIKERVHE